MVVEQMAGVVEEAYHGEDLEPRLRLG